MRTDVDRGARSTSRPRFSLLQGWLRTTSTRGRESCPERRAGEPWKTIAVVINWITWFAFIAEAVLMLRVVDDRWRWVREHPLDVAIILVTPPFLPPSLQALRVFRLLRLLPLLRAGLLARRLLTTEGVRDVAVLAVLSVLGGGAAFAAVETNQDLTTWDGVWWAVETVTTVGYGDHASEDRRGARHRHRRDAGGHRLGRSADGRRRAVHARTGSGATAGGAARASGRDSGTPFGAGAAERRDGRPARSDEARAKAVAPVAPCAATGACPD